MKVRNVEGVAIHNGPESCVGAGNCADEALTGERAGWVSSREIHASLREQRVHRDADALEVGGRQHWVRRECKARRDPARSETPSMFGSTTCGNREIPCLPVAKGAAGRIGKPKGGSR